MLINQAQTAIAAYHSPLVNQVRSSQREQVLSLLQEHGGDWCISEFSHAFGWEKSSVSRAFNELLASGDLVEADARKSTVTGILSRPVKLPPGQDDLF